MKLRKVLLVTVALIALAFVFWLLFSEIFYAIKKARNKRKSKENGMSANSMENIEKRGFGSFDSSQLNVIESIYNPNDTTPIEEHKNRHLFDGACGILKNQKRIEGGERAPLFAFPWIVSFFMVSESMSNGSYFCGGSLISEHLIITAHHCVPTTTTGFKVVIRLGEYDISTEQDCAIENDVKDCADPIQEFYPEDYLVMLHPEYNIATNDNDIALIKLKKPAKISQNNIKKVCLPFGFDKVEQNLTVIGFGLTEKSESERDSSNVLLLGRVEVIDNKNCTKLYDGALDSRPLSEGQFCAAGRDKNGTYVDTCKGDSGSPIMFLQQSGTRRKREVTPWTKANVGEEDYDDYEEDKEYEDSSEVLDAKHLPKPNQPSFYQVGVVSFGEKKKCGEGARPGIYVKVYTHLRWILDNAAPYVEETTTSSTKRLKPLTTTTEATTKLLTTTSKPK